MTTRCMVVLSGGQDSATCLHVALREYDEVRAVSFNYGQRHATELDEARRIAAAAKVPHQVLDIPALKGGALTDPSLAVSASGGFGGFPTTFVPMRNMVFLSLAAGLAVQWAEHEPAILPRPVDVMTGVCETDFSGYPDCRRATMDALQQALTLAVDRPVRLVTPLMYLSKADTVRLAQRLGFPCMDAVAMSVTCYHGQRPGCGACPACELRARGFAEAGIADPAHVAVQLESGSNPIPGL